MESIKYFENVMAKERKPKHHTGFTCDKIKGNVCT